MNETELLTLLFEKPGLYIGHGSIERANAFVSGYTFARASAADATYRGFDHWLRNRLEVRQDLDWVSVVSLFGRGEADSFRLGRELWHEYLTSVRIKSVT